ncbi:hypothetical protein BKA04_000564 [Cryobacterium mesophilum]|uniref:Uncharacterized protein n=1 Tax=Terrimesophilobacter mesophilus TaxID=433647 RepID=A0A4R8VAX4_9MICO|nr:hypothetical protein [Terrimesophilobacter mesophilus]MBB5632341.1 hypothetical protein [Terrimesophilobacter mesophilus]TFB79182.1 hypothetical protein E3N84_03390 [Terrimesophilobacter mesophilus]
MTRWARVARGSVAAVVSLFVAAFSHSVAGGSLPGVAGISLCLTFSIIVCTALAGHRMPRVRLAASIVASQAMYHGIFGSLGSSTVASAGTIGHVHTASIDFGAIPAHVHSSGDMLFAHVVAAFVTFLVLAFGERSVLATLEATRRFALSLLPQSADVPLASTPARLLPSRVRRTIPQHQRAVQSGLRYRGPPTALAI